MGCPSKRVSSENRSLALPSGLSLAGTASMAMGRAEAMLTVGNYRRNAKSRRGARCWGPLAGCHGGDAALPA